MAEISNIFDSILILDFGSQYSHLIARRIRELGVYCELLPCTAKLSEVPFKPKGIILSGGPSSVYDKDAPHADKNIWNADIPILGICYGLQEMVWSHNGKISPCSHREYGHANLDYIHKDDTNQNCLFKNLTNPKIWMSHGDQVETLPKDFKKIGSTKTAPYAAISHVSKKLYGIQFHPEVTHSVQGRQILSNFVLTVCQAEANWKMENFIDNEISRIKAKIPSNSHVIGAVSGGVDSTVAAKIMNMAIGDRFHPIFVDNGLLRQGEVDQVVEMFRDDLKIDLKVSYSADEFLSLLKDVTDPEKKRKIIGNTFNHIFDREAALVKANLKDGDADYLLQGTLYPDVIESISFKGPSATIKTHHNVGGLLKDMKLKLIEPFRELFKDEVRALGKLLNINPSLLWRHPFPGPGMAIRILGEVTEEQLEINRRADFIFMQEIRNAGIYESLAQAFTVLLPVKSVGVMGDGRTYEQAICLRAVESTDFMTADWAHLPDDLLRRVSTRIINEVNGVNRVVYDVSSKPPATIEWE